MNNETNETPLNKAILNDDIRQVKDLVDKGADVNAKTINGEPANTQKKANMSTNQAWDFLAQIRMPLHLAAMKGNADIALILVKAGAELHAKAMGDKTPLQVATEHNDKDSVIVFFLQGAMERPAKRNREKAEELLRELD